LMPFMRHKRSQFTFTGACLLAVGTQVSSRTNDRSSARAVADLG
jgi:hypothetical protein